jgi:hypothetical protein
VVEVAPLWHQRHSEFFTQQIAPHNKLELRQVSIAGEPGRLRDAREIQRLPGRDGPSV